MEIVGSALGIVAIIAGVVAAFFLFKFIFVNFWVSRVISVIFAIVCLVMSFSLKIGEDSSHFWDLGLPYAICMICACMFMMGPVIFDREWDGTWEITDTEIRPHIVGGFFGNLIGWTVIVFIATVIALATELSGLALIYPVAVLLFNAWTIYQALT